MKRKMITAVSAAFAALALSNCSQLQSQPTNFSADFGRTGNLPVATSDCKVVCARATGESNGLSILGILPITSPSETAAIKDMYDNARARGANVEGESRFFVNKSIERSSKNYILWSRTSLKASGDLIQYMSPRPVMYASPTPANEGLLESVKSTMKSVL